MLKDKPRELGQEKQPHVLRGLILFEENFGRYKRKTEHYKISLKSVFTAVHR